MSSPTQDAFKLVPQITVYCKTTFIGFHRWKDAPESVRFLRDYHRHVFHVKLVQKVDHDNRAVEFITLKRELDDWLGAMYHEKFFDHSCEQIAKNILKTFSDCFVCDVSEDDENGATVIVAVDPKEAERVFVSKVDSVIPIIMEETNKISAENVAKVNQANQEIKEFLIEELQKMENRLFGRED